jgi:glycosyltransferase involved in cell wall biosynthesis
MSNNVKITMLGASLDQNGGIATVEKLIIKHAPSDVNIKHITTHDDGSGVYRIKVFLTGLLLFIWTLLTDSTDIIHIHLSDGGSVLRKALLAKIAFTFGKPVIIHAHGAEFDKKYSHYPFWMQQIFSRVFRQCDIFIALSKTWKDYYIDKIGLDEKQITILPNPTELPSIIPNRSNVDKIKLGFFGRIGSRKGTFDLIEAYAGLPEELKKRSELIIAGDGEIDNAKNLVDTFHLQENVTFVGWIDANTRDTLLAKIDIFVLPSYNEGLPMALLEAMGWGLPVIVTPVGGIPELITSGLNGLMVIPGDTEMLSQTIQELIEDENYRLSLGQAARLTVAPHNVNNYSNSLNKIYTSVLKPISTVVSIPSI